ncbi:MAG: ribosome maturation factor RimP [Actinobacteria bacterium]|nr:ribosome maturation factor RimP [Actinomycetota bacterium]
MPAATANVERIVDARLSEAAPDVDLLEVTIVGRDTLRLVIDHPGGVDHALCADVTRLLDATGLRERFGVEVWSPGPKRPLRTHAHFAAATGRRVRLRVAESTAEAAPARSITGTVRAADERAVHVDRSGDVLEISLASIRRARLLTDEEEA